MALLKEEKQQIISDNARGDADTGSPEVQVALLSTRIAELTEHLKTHPRITTPVEASSAWSGGGAACWTTCGARTSSATVRSSASSAFVASRLKGSKMRLVGPEPDGERSRHYTTRSKGSAGSVSRLSVASPLSAAVLPLTIGPAGSPPYRQKKARLGAPSSQEQGGNMNKPEAKIVERKIGDEVFRFEAGRVAGQANGAVLVDRRGDDRSRHRNGFGPARRRRLLPADGRRRRADVRGRARSPVGSSAARAEPSEKAILQRPSDRPADAARRSPTGSVTRSTSSPRSSRSTTRTRWTSSP